MHKQKSQAKKQSFQADSKIDSSNEAKYVVLALQRDRVETRKTRKEKFRGLLNMLDKPKKKDEDKVTVITTGDKLKSMKTIRTVSSLKSAIAESKKSSDNLLRKNI